MGFYLVETSVIALALLFYMPTLVAQVIALRTGTTLVVHGLASGIVGLWVSRAETRGGLLFPLMLATALHASYNLLVVGL
jgi:hypothetical protein